MWRRFKRLCIRIPVLILDVIADIFSGRKLSKGDCVK